MDIFFADPSEVPLPPEEVRIRELRTEAWPDGRRVRVDLEVDPFQLSPSADLVILDEEGEQVASASVISSMDRRMELTLHLRGAVAGGEYRLCVTLFYAEIEEEPGPEGELKPIQRTIIDTAQAVFRLPE